LGKHTMHVQILTSAMHIKKRSISLPVSNLVTASKVRTTPEALQAYQSVRDNERDVKLRVDA